MKTSRSERDYVFGSAMVSLRAAISLKQAELANLLGISRLAVGKWEGGINYPKAEHLKKVIVLGVKNQAFPAGREAEEIRALWKAAHQKVLLDEDWLSMLLSQPLSPQEPIACVPCATGVPCTTDIRNRVDAGHDPYSVTGLYDLNSSRPTPDKTRKQSQWLMRILTALFVLTIIEFGRRAFSPRKR